MVSHLEHAVDQLGDVFVGQTGGPGDFHQRPQHLGEFSFVYHAVTVVVAHVEYDSQLVLRLAPREQHDGVQKLLKPIIHVKSFIIYNSVRVPPGRRLL